MTDDVKRLMACVDAGRDAEVVAWASDRAHAGEPDAQFLMGYRVFGAVDVDWGEALAWLRLAAAQHHPEALCELAMIDESKEFPNTGDPTSDGKRDMLRRAAQLGSVRAQRELGCLLATGEGGFAKDACEARLWYERAARSGHVDAQYNVGLMYLFGEGGAASIQNALHWLERAAAATTDEPTRSSALEVLLDIYEGRVAGSSQADPQRALEIRRRLAEMNS